VSVSLSLATLPAEPWPLWLASAGVARRVDLRAGDAVLYKGTELPHWREAFTGEQVVQVFLHYVDRDGPHREWAFDRRPQLGSSPAARLLLQGLLLA
jgi:hypothetical protein